MTDDEINDLIIEHYATSGEVNDVVAFARVIADIEREACLAIAEAYKDQWMKGDSHSAVALSNVVDEIKARGEPV